jgi:hypothetical protein
MSASRVISGKVGVWLTPYSSLGPKQLADGDGAAIVRDVDFSQHDMAPEWTRIGTAQVQITLEPTDQIINNKIDALRTEQKKVVADAQKKSTDLEREIQQLLAITYDGGAA